MPPTETRAGDSRRDPHGLLVLAALLLLLRVGVSVWEHGHPPRAAETQPVLPGPSAPLRPGP